MKPVAPSKTKPSNTPWLGQVPEHWEVKRADALLEEQRKVLQPETFSGKNVFHYSIPSIQETGDGTVEEGETIASAKTHITQDVLLVSKLNPRKGTVLIGRPREELTVCSGEFIPLVARGCDLHYAEYVYRSEEVRQQLDAAVRSVTRSHQRATPEDIRKITWAWPPLPEQRAIAAYLDERTARIDGLVARQRRLVQLLKEKRQALITRAVTRGLNPNAKMKDSGVPWLGEVPVGWALPALNGRYEILLGKMLDEKRLTKTELVPYLRNIDVQWDYVNIEDLHEMDISPSEYERYTLKPGDLLVCEGGDIGRTAIWRGEMELCAFQKAVHRVRPRNATEHTRYFFYTMVAAHGRGVFLAEGNPNTIPHLTGEKFRRYRFPQPPHQEQVAIAEYLDAMTSQIDTLITKVEQAVERLQEYRTALISAAVTGKVRVPAG